MAADDQFHRFVAVESRHYFSADDLVYVTFEIHFVDRLSKSC